MGSVLPDLYVTAEMLLVIVSLDRGIGGCSHFGEAMWNSVALNASNILQTARQRHWAGYKNTYADCPNHAGGWL